MCGNFGRAAGLVTLKELKECPQLGQVNRLVLQTHITSTEALEMRRGLQKTVHGIFCASLEYVESDRCQACEPDRPSTSECSSLEGKGRSVLHA